MIGTRAAIYLDPKLIIHTEEPTAPFFDEVYRKRVQGGGIATIACLELKEKLNDMDAKKHETPDDTHSFPAIVDEIIKQEMCPHNVPVIASCSWCMEGVASTTTEDPTTYARIISSTWDKKRVSRVYGLSRWQRVSLFVRTWLKEH